MERALQAVASWLSADAAGCRVASGSANLLWRASLLCAAAGPPAPPPWQCRLGAGPHSSLPGCLRSLPGLAPRLGQAHLREARAAAAGLQASVLPLLQDALDRLCRAAAEAREAAGAPGAPAAVQEAAALLAALHSALAVRTCARALAAAQLAPCTAAALEAAEPASSAVGAAAAAWGSAAQEWEAGALALAEDFAALEQGVWVATAGSASLSEMCSL